MIGSKSQALAALCLPILDLGVFWSLGRVFQIELVPTRDMSLNQTCGFVVCCCSRV